MIPDLNAIEEAARRIDPFAHKTPVLTSVNLDELTGGQLFFKCENFQKAGAFKFRGATNTIRSLPGDALKKGVATHSSGNHAQALSLAAQMMGVEAHIVMPENSPKVKVAAVKHYGGNITFCKPTLQAREDTLKDVIDKTGATEIHPYNNHTIIAGQATAARELIHDVPGLDIIVAPVGGGGLLSGTALSTYYLSAKTKVFAAEPEQADDAYQSFYQGKFIPSVNPNTIADGLRTSLGSLTYPIITKYVDQIVRVSEEGIIKAMKLIWERMKIIIEPSAAVPLAAILENTFECRKKRIGIILSGGNLDLDKLPWIQ
ncbi:MAG: pyridoxal-phosphate dependent enzyme [Bacteroidales bacterium]|nr:pyridoxal-phosphate dependent enzyme [Bacteroidales bacterium]